MRILSILEAGRRDFLDACNSPFGPRRQSFCWTPPECIEHVVIAENRYLDWLCNDEDSEALAPPPRDAHNENRLFLMIRNHEEKRECPAPLWPQGRFRTVEEAVGEFQRARNRSIDAAAALGEAGLYSRAVNHPYFGVVNGVELLQLIDGHARRHADQLREMS